MDSEECRVKEDLTRETDNFWSDPKNILALIDLIFLNEDPDKKKICS